MVPKINISQLMKKAKEEYFAALRLLENLPNYISLLKENLLKEENDNRILLNKLKIFIENCTVVFRYLGYADTTVLEVN